MLARRIDWSKYEIFVAIEIDDRQQKIRIHDVAVGIYVQDNFLKHSSKHCRISAAAHRPIVMFLAKSYKNILSRLTELGVFLYYASVVNAGIAQLVERNLAKVEVEGSRPFSRSRIRRKLAKLPFLLTNRFSEHHGLITDDSREMRE